MKQKLLMTASTFSHICSFHLPYIAAFHRLGWEVHIACGGNFQEIPFADRQFRLPLEKKYIAAANLKTLAVLNQLMREHEYGLVIAHTSLASFFTRMAEVGIKPHPWTINVVHGYLFDNDTNKIKAMILKAAEFLASPKTDMIITMNRFDTRWAERAFPKKKLRFVPGMGVDAEKYRQVKRSAPRPADGALTLVYPAEFSKRKNQSMLIRGMALLPESVRLVLPGEGTLLETCKALAKELGVENRVIFPGFVRDIGKVLAHADIAVSSSRSEGLPFNLIEAMTFGLPVVASNVKGNADLVIDGTTGFLFPYNDEKAFATAVKKLLDHRALLETMGEAGRGRAEAFSVQRVLPTVMEAYLDYKQTDDLS